ncbi:DUF4326 domain-containing protein [Streptomyces clavuligerus]|uniref:DUF4326 domain-containing protein n=1 Tax=Streptomyces clavuligerus TaxID=1901 RepID=UPI00018008B8|nr:DUF4326 domain-containing protein [Streptomyces clavuligerus]EDY52984.1 hypothetical protein SSCG_06066 [Streptomyces clavuligerus]WDN56001.1 DUF4326 domain-containing protein [Streptomyces clavuligerus]
MPTRLQRRRTKGWHAPAGAVYVGRGTRWGNPARVVHSKATGGWHVDSNPGGSAGVWPTTDGARRFAAEVYRTYLTQHPGLAHPADRRAVAARH